MTTLAREKNNTSRMRTYVKNKEETNLLDLFKEKIFNSPGSLILPEK